MKNSKPFFRLALVVVFAGLLAGCATYPAGPSYMVKENATPGPDQGYLNVGPNDVYYTMRVDDRTPFGVRHLPESTHALYQRGYDEVRRQREADFEIDIALSAFGRDNPDVRAGHVVGGALLGAAAGAIIGGATGDPGTGAAIGAASGGALGLVSPADTPLVRIDITIRGLRDRNTSYKSTTIDLASVPPPDVRGVIDHQVARMLQTLPAK